ncbi:MAG: hypothetical protein Fur0028_12860 [Bacteroidales bacterium]
MASDNSSISVKSYYDLILTVYIKKLTNTELVTYYDLDNITCYFTRL